MDSISAVTLVRAESINGMCTATALIERSGICLLGDGAGPLGGASSDDMAVGSSGEISRRSPDRGIQPVREDIA